MTIHWHGPVVALLAGSVIATTISCGDRPAAGPGVDSPAARRLDGAWVIALQAERVRFESVATRASDTRVVHGEIALVPNHWLDGGDAIPFPTHYGTYDIDFGVFGFDPRSRGELPRVAARVGARDSVVLVLEPDDPHERVQLHGAWRGDSIVGTWSLEPVRVGGDAAGSFSMARRGTT